MLLSRDAYDSLYVLFQAKGLVNAIRSDGSLWLLDPSVRMEAGARIDQSEQALIGHASTDGATARALADGMQAAMQTEQQGDSGTRPDAGAENRRAAGHRTGQRHLRHPGARGQPPAAINQLLAAAAYVRTNQAQALRDRAGAVADWLREAPGGGVPVFAAVQDALGPDDRREPVRGSTGDTIDILAGSARIAPVTLAALAVVVLLSAGRLWRRRG